MSPSGGLGFEMYLHLDQIVGVLDVISKLPDYAVLSLYTTSFSSVLSKTN